MTKGNMVLTLIVRGSQLHILVRGGGLIQPPPLTNRVKMYLDKCMFEIYFFYVFYCFLHGFAEVYHL